MPVHCSSSFSYVFGLGMSSVHYSGIHMSFFSYVFRLGIFLVQYSAFPRMRSRSCPQYFATFFSTRIIFLPFLGPRKFVGDFLASPVLTHMTVSGHLCSCLLTQATIPLPLHYSLTDCSMSLSLTCRQCLLG